MTVLETFQADAPELAERFSIISKVISHNFNAPYRAESLGAHQEPAKFSWASVGGVSISRAQMPALKLANQSAGGRRLTADATYYLYTADQISLLKLENGVTLHIQPDELVILRSDMASEWTMKREYRTSCFMIRGEIFQRKVPHHEAIVGRRLVFPFAINYAIRDLMESGWASASAGKFDSIGPVLADSLLDLLSLVQVLNTDGRSRGAASALEIRRAQIKAFMEKNFADPDLSVASIGHDLRLTPRYMQLAFSPEGITPSEYLRNYRISASAKMLRDPQYVGRTISHILYSCGFNSAAHFSTEFKRTCGVSPREYRSMRLNG